MSKFISLHNHTYYSILDALPSPKDLILRAKELGQSAIAITDHGTFSSLWEGYKAAKDNDIKLIVGAEFYFLTDADRKDEKIRHLILLAKNATGYKNLLTLHRNGFDHSILAGRKVLPIIDWKALEAHNEGVLCLTSCGNGIIAQHINAKDFGAAETDLQRLLDIFGKERLGIEVQTHNLTRPPTAHSPGINQIFTNYQLIRLAKKFDVKVVPTCNTHYLSKEQAETHDMFLAIGAMQPVYSNARLRYSTSTSDLYLKSYEEVKHWFSRNFGDEFADEICENTLYFADQCETPDWVDPKFSNPSGKELPSFPVKDEPDYQEFLRWLDIQSSDIKSLDEDKSYLRYKCYAEFNSFKKKISIEKRAQYSDRLEKELSVLEKQGFSSYMLIVGDFINWAKRNNIAVGPGRGSVGSSIIAYFLGIHSADPIKYNLIFERFQNIEKKLPPDVDSDIAKSSRDKVIDYIYKKYGNDYTSQISNIVNITPKVYVRDVSRSSDLGNDRKKSVELGNNIADTFLAKYKTIKEVIEQSPLFVEYTKRYPQINKFQCICNKPRAVGCHAAGIILGKRPLADLVPLRKDKDGNLIIEYDKDMAEENGLIKMDVLGLSTLDTISATNELIAVNNKTIPIIDYDQSDKKTYDLITSGDTFGVFQFGTSAGTMDLCRKIKPKNIDDLAIITTLARPAAANIREEFISTRNSKRSVALTHESLKRAFAGTYGFGLYDESILQLGSDVAGWSLNEADRLRKMIKDKGKHPEKEKKLRDDFIAGAIKNGIIEKIAIKIWDDEVSKFRGYTFNRSLHFLESVDIYTKEGKFIAAKSIQDITAGDFVRSRDENTKKDMLVLVKNKHDHGILPLYEVELSTGEKVKCTMNHKFRTKENGEMLTLKQIIKDGLTIIVNIAGTIQE